MTALAAYLHAYGRAVLAGTLQAASTSAIMSDRSSWLRLPPPMPPAPASMRCPNFGRSEHGGLHICRFYFPLEHIVLSEVLAWRKFSPSLGGEEGFKKNTDGKPREATWI